MKELLREVPLGELKIPMVITGHQMFGAEFQLRVSESKLTRHMQAQGEEAWLIARSEVGGADGDYWKGVSLFLKEDVYPTVMGNVLGFE